MRALLDLNILWKSKYFEFFHIEHQLYVQVAEDWLAQRYTGMNQYERLMFWLYRKQNKDMNLSAWRSGAGPPSRRALDPRQAAKADERWDLANLYFSDVHDSKGLTR